MRILLTILSLVLSTSLFADTTDIWNIMPDSICGIDKSDVISHNDSTDILNIQVSSTLSVQAVSSNTEDSLIYVVKTYSAPEKESLLKVYDRQWNIISSRFFTLTDIISKTDAEKVAKYYSPLLISAEILSSDNIKLSVADFMLSDDEKKEIKAIVEKKEDATNDKNSGSENVGGTLLSRTVAIATLF